MNMRIAPLTMHYTVEQAAELLNLLDTLRDALWETYGEQIVNMHRQQCAHQLQQDQYEFDFDDEIPF